jgi:hypothetical protein
VIVFFVSVPIYGRYVEGVNHVHDTNSDGVVSEEGLIKSAIDLKLDFMFFTPHLSCVTGVCKDKTHFHPNYDFSKNYYDSQGSGDNILRCAEVFTNLDKAHVLLLGCIGKSINDNNFKNLNGNLPPSEIIKFTEKNNLVTVLAHPHDAYDPNALNKFNAVEFFNTKGYKIWNNTILQLNGKYWDAETIDLDIYRQSILNFINDSKKYKLIAVTGGCDAHFFESFSNRNFQKEELSYGHTFARLEDNQSITCENILQAIRLGKTYAVNYSNCEKSIKIDDLNYHPQFVPYKVSEVLLKGSINFSGDVDKNNSYLEIYRDGQKYKVLKVNSKKFNFIFSDSIEKEHIYFLYIKGKLITSPIVFDRFENENTSTPVLTKTKTINNFAPSVSPDGKLIAFISDRDGENEIYLMDIDGLVKKRITHHSMLLGYPTWWPDSKGIVFTSQMCGKKDIWLVKIDNVKDNEKLICLTKKFTEDCSSPIFKPYSGEIGFWVNKSRIVKIRFFSDKWSFVEADPNQKYIFTEKSQIVLAKANKEDIKYLSNNYHYGLYGLNIGRDMILYNDKNGNDDIYLRKPDGTEIPLIVLPGDQRYASATKIGNDTVIFFDSTHMANSLEHTGQDIYRTNMTSNAKIIRLTHGSE